MAQRKSGYAVGEKTMGKLRAERVVAWAILTFMALGATVWLSGCDTGTHHDPPDYRSGHINVFTEGFDGTSATRWKLTPQQKGYVQELAYMWSQTIHVDTGLNAQGTEVTLYPDIWTCSSAYFKAGVSVLGRRFMAWPIVGGGFHYGFMLNNGQVHVTVGPKITTSGFGPHLIEHIWLRDQTNGPPDITHQRPEWPIWEGRGRQAANGLKAQR